MKIGLLNGFFYSLIFILARRSAQVGPQGQQDLEDDIEWDDRAENIAGDSQFIKKNQETQRKYCQVIASSERFL
ncbi:hypothetical protein HUJ04_011708 [Dendroctonus ponderosae]|nr:hypothetical protein HUJ04_011708 [Dendroctonus ponderosae]